MRDKIIQAMAFPRSLVRAYMELEQCPHHGNYCPEDNRCRCCTAGPECWWLSHNDEHVAVEHKDTKALVRSLAFAYQYVDDRITEWGHNRRKCTCDACSWLRNTVHLLAALQSGEPEGDATPDERDRAMLVGSDATPEEPLADIPLPPSALRTGRRQM